MTDDTFSFDQLAKAGDRLFAGHAPDDTTDWRAAEVPDDDEADDDATAQEEEEARPTESPATNERSNSAVDTDLRAAVHADMQPVYDALAKALQQASNGESPAIDFDALTDAVMDNGTLEAAMLGDALTAALKANGMTEPEITQLIEEAANATL